MNKQGGEKSFTWDDPAILLGIFATIYIAGWATWYFAHEKISMIYMHIRYAQLWLLSALGGLAEIPGVTAVHDWVQEMCQPDGLASMCHRDFSTVEWQDISNSSLVMNVFFLLMMFVMCVRMFLRVNATHPKLNFTKTHNIKSFVKENRKLYPHLRLFSEIDLISQPLDHPIFGMSLTSRQFAYHHRLINGWKEETDGSWTPSLDRIKAQQVFRKQLGGHWTSANGLSVGETLLVAIAMPRVAATDPSLDDAKFKSAMQDSDGLLSWCWGQFKPPVPTKDKKADADGDPFAWLQPNIDLAYPRSIITKYAGYPTVKPLIYRYAYNRTIIFALFMQARRLGVLQPAEMRWLRFFDRGLWYVLETIGRQAAFSEAAGVLSHYLYESKSGIALAEPQLDKAINGLELAMTAFKFTEADKKRYEENPS